MYQFRREPVEEAQPLFRKAIELAPEFAAPHAALPFRYGVRHTFGWGLVTSEEKSELIALADRAVDLDNDDANVLVHAGFPERTSLCTRPARLYPCPLHW
jgi:hypothetical protein